MLAYPAGASLAGLRQERLELGNEPVDLFLRDSRPPARHLVVGRSRNDLGKEGEVKLA